MPDLRFCAYQYQHLPLDMLRKRWRDAERFGFDVLWNCDTVVEPDRRAAHDVRRSGDPHPDGGGNHEYPDRDAGPSLYFRHPVTLTKAAMTVDHLSGGRVELALGVGDPSAGAGCCRRGLVDRRTGRPVPRVRRTGRPPSTAGGHELHGPVLPVHDAETIPLPVQRPRPPITIAAHGPKMLRIAAEHGDGWSSWGGYGVSNRGGLLRRHLRPQPPLRRPLRRRRARPAHLRHSLVVLPPADALGVARILHATWSVASARSASTSSYCTGRRTWRPAPGEDAVFEEVMNTVIPQMRASR